MKMGPICPDMPPGPNTVVIGFEASGPKRPRLAGPCAGKGCAHWNENGCAKLCRVLTQLRPDDVTAQLPRCDIQKDCVWYQQNGAVACAGCRAVRWV